MTALGDVVGVVLHDTVTPPSLDERMIEWARDGITQRISKTKTIFIPGPLYNELVMRDGSHLVIAGDEKANHAGRINSARFDLLATKNPPPAGRPPSASEMTANSRLYGIAWVRGNGESVTEPARLAMIERTAIAVERFGLSFDQVWAHAELTRRKIDPQPAYSKTAEIRTALHDRHRATEPAEHVVVIPSSHISPAQIPDVDAAVGYLNKALRALGVKT